MGAKKYADKVAKAASDNAGTALTNKIAELKNTDKAVANQFVAAVKEANGVVTVERKALVAADIPELGMSKITGLEDALGGKQGNLTFEGAYDAGTNKVATESTVSNAKATLIGNTSAEATTTDGNTIADVRRYVDAKTEGVASDAKLTELSNKVTTNTNDIKTIKDSLAEGGSVSNAIADAKKAGTDAATAVSNLEKGQVKTNTDAIAAINNAETGILKQAKDYADGKDTAIAAAKTQADKGVADAAAAKTTADAAQSDVDALETYVGTIPEGATSTNVVAYIQEKTSGIATSENLEALTARVTTAESEIDAIQNDYLKAADKTALETSIAAAKKAGDDAQADIDAFMAAADVGTAAVDTLKEIQDYITSDGAAAATMTANIAANASAIESNTNAIEALDAKVGDIP